ncbi:hypothetical protein B0A55_09935 [Friedmanniomyces simplex]|uniref:Amino acid permease/ SLC12A domain-containing protein n=1 Tax=Friedmanniomyces simplex TaxID=329884 RepID=A0A4U0WXW9_9PEZI|nr:hypothetical protein B0A55_09935 [Friedmanniomyces simplex]
MKHLPRTGSAPFEVIEISEQNSGVTTDAKRMEELGRRPEIALPRRLVHRKAVIGLASTVVITWQNMLFLAAIALSTGGLAGYFWISLVVFAAMYVVYIGLREKAERWPVAAGQYFWVAQLAPQRYAKLLSFLSGWKLMVSWQVFLAAGVMIVGNGIAAIVALHNGSSQAWLPTVLGISITFLIFVANRYDCIFHLGEEIKAASTIMPAALMWATAVNFTLGLITVLVIDFSITDIDALLSTSLSQSGPVGPVIQIFATATASRTWTTAISILLLATFIPCCANSNTAATRQLWAFAEDGALPKSLWIRKERHGVPSNALSLTLIGPIALSLLNLFSPVALNAIISLVIINLMVSYLLVAATSLYNRYTGGGDAINEHVYRLTYRQGTAVDVFSIIFITASLVIAMFPPLLILPHKR